MNHQCCNMLVRRIDDCIILDLGKSLQHATSYLELLDCQERCGEFKYLSTKIAFDPISPKKLSKSVSVMIAFDEQWTEISWIVVLPRRVKSTAVLSMFAELYGSTSLCFAWRVWQHLRQDNSLHRASHTWSLGQRIRKFALTRFYSV